MARLAIGITLFIALLADPASGIGRDPALTEARLEEQAGDPEAAARLYAEWLKENSSSAEAPVVFLRYAALEQNFSSLIEQGSRFLSVSRKGIKSSTAAARIARLFEVAGRTEEARDAYLAASRGGEPPAALEAAFLLSLEMNDTSALQAGLDAFKDSGGEWVEFLRACLSFQRGDDGPANAVLLRIADSTKDEEVALKALWVSYEISRRAPDSSSTLEAVKRLQDRFPRSPEYLMAQGSRSAAASGARPSLVPLELPGRFLGPQDSPPPTDSEAGGKPSPPPQESSPSTPDATAARPTTLSVQAGSFQMKENADDLVVELSRRGFSPSVRVDSSQGRQLYRVMAGSGLADDDARALLDRLHAAGLSGFLLKDQ